MKSDIHARLGVAVSETSLCAIYLLSSSGEVLSWNRGGAKHEGMGQAGDYRTAFLGLLR